MGRPYKCCECTEEMQAQRGCKEETEDERFWIETKKKEKEKEKEILTKRCPYVVAVGRYSSIIQLCSMLESGSWPEAGGTLDQANSFIQAACIVSSAKAEARKKDAR